MFGLNDCSRWTTAIRPGHFRAVFLCNDSRCNIPEFAAIERTGSMTRLTFSARNEHTESMGSELIQRAISNGQYDGNPAPPLFFAVFFKEIRHRHPLPVPHPNRPRLAETLLLKTAGTADEAFPEIQFPASSCSFPADISRDHVTPQSGRPLVERRYRYAHASRAFLSFTGRTEIILRAYRPAATPSASSQAVRHSSFTT
jgi:hypothetical protein